MFNLVPARTPRPFSAKLLSNWVAPKSALVPGVVPPQMQDFVLPCVELNPSVLDPPVLVQVFCCDKITQAGGTEK